jgi:hypothetical protein
MRKSIGSRFVPIAAVGLVVGLGAFARSMPAVAKTMSTIYADSGSWCPAGHACFTWAAGFDLFGNGVCTTWSTGTTNSTSCPDTLAGIRVQVADNWAEKCTSPTVPYNAPWGTTCSPPGSTVTGSVWGSD